MIQGYDIQTPTLLFPAISLLLLAYTNRFLGITQVIRKLHGDMSSNTKKTDFFLAQINSLSKRIDYIVLAQKLGVISLSLCIISMMVMVLDKEISFLIFICSLAAMFSSLFYTYIEVDSSKSALKFILEDCKKEKNE